MFPKSNTVKQTYIADSWLTATVHDKHKVKTVKSHILPPRYYHWHCSPSPWDLTLPLRYYRECGPITAVSPWYSHHHHYRAKLQFSQNFATWVFETTTDSND